MKRIKSIEKNGSIELINRWFFDFLLCDNIVKVWCCGVIGIGVNFCLKECYCG